MIITRLKERMLSQEDGISQQYRVKDLAPDPEPATKVQDWLQAALVENGADYPAERFVGVSDPLDEDLEEYQDEEAEEPGIPKDLPHYRNFVTNNPAYTWLLSRLEREILLVPTEPDHMQTISNTILKSLSHGPFQKISYSKSPHMCDMIFMVDWDPVAFLQEQEYNEQPNEVFERVITLTGSGADAQALTTAQYLNQTWPLVGEKMLSLLKRAIRLRGEVARQTSKHEIKKTSYDRLRSLASIGSECISDGTTLRAGLYDEKLLLQAIGTLDSVAEIGEIIGWLGAALRSSPEKQGVMYCSPFISDLTIHDQSADITTVISDIRFKFETEEVQRENMSIQDGTGKCWHDLFQNPVAVKGYPTRRKPQKDIGLEIPIEIMAKLVGSNRVSSFARSLFIKSFSIMLVLTKQMGDVFMWHLLYNRNGEHMSYADPRIHAISGLQTHTEIYPALASGRHVLGWCSNVSNLAGKYSLPK